MLHNSEPIKLDPDISKGGKLPIVTYVGIKRVLAVFPVGTPGERISSIHYALETEGGVFVNVSFQHSANGFFELDDPYADEWDNGTEAILAAYLRSGWQPGNMSKAIEARKRSGRAVDDITTGPGERGTF
jgi:hypothetical protein